MRREFAVAAIAVLFVSAAAHAATTIALAPGSGHPGIAATVTGAGFADSELIDLYFDTGDVELLSTNTSGGFSYTFTVPTTAQPSVHYVTAIGRGSGDFGQFAFNVNTNWSEFGFGGAHLGWNPFENTVNTGNVGTLGTLWSSGTAQPLGSTPAVVQGKVYVPTAAGLQALNASTGAVLWTAATTKVFVSSPAVSGNSVYVASTDGVLYALNASTGAMLWNVSLSSYTESSPVVVNGVIYFGSGVNVYAVQASTGKTLWTYATGNDIDGSPAVVGNVVYIGSQDDYVYALNATTGTKLWSHKTGSFVESSPIVVDGILFVGSDDDKIYAIDATTNPGTVLWSVTTSDSVFDTPAFYNGIVYIGSEDGTMRALQAQTGATVWSLTTSIFPHSATVANGVVYFTDTDGNLYGVDANYGDVLLSGNLGPTYFGAPAISNGTLYVAGYAVATNALALEANVNAVPIAKNTAPHLASLHPDMSLKVAN